MRVLTACPRGDVPFCGSHAPQGEAPCPRGTGATFVVAGCLAMPKGCVAASPRAFVFRIPVFYPRQRNDRGEVDGRLLEQVTSRE